MRSIAFILLAFAVFVLSSCAQSRPFLSSREPDTSAVRRLMHRASGHTRVFTLRASPKFVKKERCMCFTIEDKNHWYQFPWALFSGAKLFPVDLQADERYTFKVEEVGPHEGVIPEIIEVRRGGEVVFKRGWCEVHRIKMKKPRVPIRYGLYLPEKGDPSPETERKLFPHWEDFANGGCVFMVNHSPLTTTKHVCPKCVEAHSAWQVSTHSR